MTQYNCLDHYFKELANIEFNMPTKHNSNDKIDSFIKVRPLKNKKEVKKNNSTIQSKIIFYFDYLLAKRGVVGDCENIIKRQIRWMEISVFL